MITQTKKMITTAPLILKQKPFTLTFIQKSTRLGSRNQKSFPTPDKTSTTILHRAQKATWQEFIANGNPMIPNYQQINSIQTRMRSNFSKESNK